MAMDYATKWVEGRALHSNITIVMVKFLYKWILIRFWRPFTLVSYQGVHFINDTISHLVNHFFFVTLPPSHITLRVMSKYNLLTKWSRQCWPNWLTKKNDWDKHSGAVLFAHCTTNKVNTKHIPFQLVYALCPLMFKEYLVPTLTHMKALLLIIQFKY